tara:strand:- start:3067 stop:3255 length:189 start_codon:yes stop_codon:yes gene_type:complete
MLNNFLRKVHIKLWPIEMTRRLLFNIKNYADRLLFKPGEVVVRHEKLTVVGQKPHTENKGSE